MSNHTIQVRDLITELQRHDPTAGVLCSRGNEEMCIDVVRRHSCRSREISINVHGEDKIADLEDQIEKLENWKTEAEELFTKLKELHETGGTNAEIVVALEDHMKEVLEFIP